MMGSHRKTLNSRNNHRRKPRISNNTLWSILMLWIGFYLRYVIDMFQTISSPSLEVSEPTRNEVIKGKKHWCVVGLKYLPYTTREHFKHFPHASEIILPCWSYFMEQETTDNCGFYLASRFLNLTSWPKELIEGMGCDVQYGNGLREDGFVPELPKNDVQHIPNLYLLRPRFEYMRYIKHPSHAHALRRKFVTDEYILSKKGRGKPIQIGMIQRKESRRIGNFEELRDAISQAIPNANVITTDFEFKTVKEQAEWFATKDVICAAHGAALTNAVFITEGTIVMQLYPPGYFWASLDPLIEQSGGHAIQWYKKGTNPMVEAATMDREAFDVAGKATFSPPVDEVVRPLLYTLEIERPTNAKCKRLFGKFI